MCRPPFFKEMQMPAKPSSARSALAPATWFAGCLLAIFAIFGLCAIEWTTYDSFDHKVFDIRVAVLAPVSAFIEACTCP